jgi:hypothetical protein
MVLNRKFFQGILILTALFSSITSQAGLLVNLERAKDSTSLITQYTADLTLAESLTQKALIEFKYNQEEFDMAWVLGRLSSPANPEVGLIGFYDANSIVLNCGVFMAIFAFQIPQMPLSIAANFSAFTLSPKQEGFDVSCKGQLMFSLEKIQHESAEQAEKWSVKFKDKKIPEGNLLLLAITAIEYIYLQKNTTINRPLRPTVPSMEDLMSCMMPEDPSSRCIIQ